MLCHVGVPTSPPYGEDGLGGELGSELTTGVLERCGVGLPVSCGGGPNCQEQCGVGGRLLASGCLGSRSVKMPVVRWSCRRVSPFWAAGCPELCRVLARLKACESVLGSLLSGEAWRSGGAAGE